MYIDQVQFDGSTCLLSDIPETLGCHECSYSNIHLFIFDEDGEQGFQNTYSVDDQDECMIPIRAVIADYMDHYQLDRFMGTIKIMEDEDNYETLQVDIINSILDVLNLPDLICFTSDFANSLDISSNAATVTVEVTADDTVIHSSTYIPYQQTVKVYDFASILENFLLSKGYTCCMFTIKLSESYATVTRSIFPIYCRQRITDITANAYYRSRFLTNNTSRLTSSNAKELLPLIADTPPVVKNIIINYYGTYLLNDGSIYSRSYSDSMFCSTPLCFIDASATKVDELLRKIGTIINGRLIRYTIVTDTRLCTYYITEARPSRSFVFRNAFNCWETLHIFASTKTKQATEYSSAICGDLLCHYDVEHSETFEEQTAALQLSNALWIREFLTSPEIRLVTGALSDPTLLPQVLIKSYTSELTNAPSDASNAITFEWQYSSQRGYRTLATHNDIFVEQFSEAFN